jgi:hypothetical protein
MGPPLPPDPRQPTIKPSTALLFARGILRAALFAGLFRLISYWREDTLGLKWAVMTGVLWGYWDMVRTYRRPEWRRTVAPEQMLGLGTAGMICLAALAFWTVQHPDGGYLTLRLIGTAVLVVLPISLLRTAWAELRLRQQGGEADPPASG